MLSYDNYDSHVTHYIIGARTYVSSDLLVTSDYGGAGSIGRGNQNWLLDQIDDNYTPDQFSFSELENFREYPHEAPRTTTPVIKISDMYCYKSFAILEGGYYQSFFEDMLKSCYFDSEYEYEALQDMLKESVDDWIAYDISQLTSDKKLADKIEAGDYNAVIYEILAYHDYSSVDNTIELYDFDEASNTVLDLIQRIEAGETDAVKNWREENYG